MNTSDMDRYTPCLSRPTEQHRRRKKIDDRKADYHETVLSHFSRFLEHQEDWITQLMRNFDIEFEGNASCGRGVVTDLDANTFSMNFANPASLSSPQLPRKHQSDKAHSTQPSAPVSRPGRLSPTTIQMILSSNTSTVSGISSAADTSYDSGLYQWLGVDMNTAPRSSTSIPVMLEEPFDDSTNFDISMMSSRSIYSQPSPEPRIALPLSPPATVLLPSSETLRGELVKDSLPRIPRFLPRHLASNQLSDLRDIITPIVPNNLSLQHYMPSASVLRHFQKVIDELKMLYVPNDTGNNPPNPDRERVFLSSCRSFPDSYMISPSRVSRRRSLHNLYSGLITQSQSKAVLPAPTMDTHRRKDTRTTRELYTEMAVMLFSQVSKEEAHVTSLRNLVNRLEDLATRKRKVAVVIGTWGREKFEQRT